ncbi:MAG: NifU N-terminal domain-containing protein [Rubricoccaceae bacterium]
MRFSVQAHPTPNPHSLKFAVVGARLIESGLAAYFSAAEAAGDPLGEALFRLEGVHSLMIVPEFATVTKHPAASWEPLARSVERVLETHLAGAVSGEAG